MPATALSAERQALAAAIERRDACAERLERVRAAGMESYRRVGQAANLAEAAQKALALAKRNETTAVLADLIGDDAPAVQTVAQATAMLADAQAGVSSAERVRDAIPAAEGAARAALDSAKAQVAEAIGQVVRAERLAPLLQEWSAALASIDYLGPLLELLPGLTSDERWLTNRSRDAHNMRVYSDPETAARRERFAPYRAWLSALDTDPAAPPPPTDFPEPAAREAA
jgi:hypothetical protein